MGTQIVLPKSYVDLKMLKKFFIALGLLLLVAFWTCYFLYSKATRLPENRPQAVLNQAIDTKKKVVVCVGDSLTHGRVSYNYVDDLDERFPDDYLFVNAGINSELAFNIRQRLDAVIALKPDFITILIGSNDVLGSLSEKSARRYIKKWKLPRAPDKPWFRENLDQIVIRLQQATGAKIALMSLPPVTENPENPGYRRAQDYSAVIREVADIRQVAYLPLNEILTSAIEGGSRRNKTTFTGAERTLLYQAIVSHYLLGRSWNDIAAKNGFLFLTDNIHLNAKGAGIAADLVDAFIRRN